MVAAGSALAPDEWEEASLCVVALVSAQRVAYLDFCARRMNLKQRKNELVLRPGL